MNNYKSQAIATFQPHPVRVAMEKTLDTQSESHPIRQEVRKLCGTYNLSATFSEDTGTLSTLKTPGWPACGHRSRLIDYLENQ